MCHEWQLEVGFLASDDLRCQIKIESRPKQELSSPRQGGTCVAETVQQRVAVCGPQMLCLSSLMLVKNIILDIFNDIHSMFIPHLINVV